MLYTREVNANATFKVPGYLEWFGAMQRSGILACLRAVSLTLRSGFAVGQWNAKGGTYESDQVGGWEGSLEIDSPANRAAIRFALADGDRCKNGDRF